MKSKKTREVIEALIETMKNKDELFKIIYRRIMYAGSFWKDTKVGKPEEFDLDIILHLPLSYNKIPPLKIPSEYCKENFYWYLVPKPSRRGDKAHLDWRCSFFPHEKDMLKKNGILPVIRQIKKLRDTQGWSSIIPSYFIETFFFHEFNLENSKNRYPWSTNSYVEIFIYMFILVVIKDVEIKPSKLAEYVLTKKEFEKYETTPVKNKI